MVEPRKEDRNDLDHQCWQNPLQFKTQFCRFFIDTLKLYADPNYFAILSSSVTTVEPWHHYEPSSHNVGGCQLHLSVSILLPAPATSRRVIGVD